LKTVKATIDGAAIKDVFQVFRRKPHGVRFNETDVVTVSARTDEGHRVISSFYLCLKPDGTFDEKTLPGGTSGHRRHQLISFLRYYGFTKNIKGYNLKEEVPGWSGKAIEIVPGKGGGAIYIP
jgi:hypothetical protein